MAAEPDDNNTWNSSCDIPNLFERNVISSFMCTICIVGLGNGAVIWLLGFRMKRTPFTTYILNLAVADFGVLISLNLKAVGDILYFNFGIFPQWWWWSPYFEEQELFQFAYSTSQFLLMAISIDKCVAVPFPFWYRCHRPLHLSSAVCAAVWIFCFLLYGLNWILPVEDEHTLPAFYVFLVTAVVCLPLVTVSILILVVRFCFKSQQRQRGKVLMVILLTLILAFPVNAILLVTFRSLNYFYYYVADPHLIHKYGCFCASLNSFVNPLIYFLVGSGRSLCRENLKLIFQRKMGGRSASQIYPKSE